MLRRFTLLGLVGGCTAFGLVAFLRDDPTTNANEHVCGRLDYAAISRKSRELTSKLDNYRVFSAMRSAIVRELAAGRISLIDACERLREVAMADYPWYLQYADFFRHHGGLKLWLAKALLTQVEIEFDSPDLPSIMDRLQREIVRDDFQAWRQLRWPGNAGTAAAGGEAL